jgi:hypothetical protein
VRNALIREELGVALTYPTYREGLSALRALGDGPRKKFLIIRNSA